MCWFAAGPPPESGTRSQTAFFQTRPVHPGGFFRVTEQFLKQREWRGVQPAVFFRFRLTAACALLAFTTGLQAVAGDPPVPDVLVYKDGDRVQGRLIAREGDTLVFRSLRFGDLRVSTDDAHVITEPAAAPGGSASAKASGTTPVTPSSSGSPWQLTRFLRDVFGPWKGRLALSTQVTRDANDRADVMIESSLKRSWAKDDVSGKVRYDYSETNDTDTTDTFKGDGMWRHSLPNRLFTVYRPSYEWNRAATISSVDSDYILLQQEVGLGVKAVDRDSWKIRVGVAENFFNNWDLTDGTERAARVESLFLEADLKLPWRVSVTERAVYYYALATGNTGWEHQLEVNKKLTETLSLGLRHESRYNDPDVRTEDYSMLKFVLGLDF